MRGRADDAIAAGPLTIYPPEIEDVLIRHPGVAEAVVVPRPNNMGGVDLVGFIVGRPGLRHEDVEAHCIANLPAVKRPKSVYYLDAIPRTGNGKIDRPAIKEAAIRLAAKV
jgi:acyl-coenzyme A synthetase/AMP-(fatty) acid ligase